MDEDVASAMTFFALCEPRPRRKIRARSYFNQLTEIRLDSPSVRLNLAVPALRRHCRQGTATSDDVEAAPMAAFTVSAVWPSQMGFLALTELAELEERG
jgi:hypothetical protein